MNTAEFASRNNPATATVSINKTSRTSNVYKFSLLLCAMLTPQAKPTPLSKPGQGCLRASQSNRYLTAKPFLTSFDDQTAVLDEFNKLLSDNTLSESELKNSTEIVKHLEDTLGYSPDHYFYMLSDNINNKLQSDNDTLVLTDQTVRTEKKRFADSLIEGSRQALSLGEVEQVDPNNYFIHFRLLPKNQPPESRCLHDTGMSVDGPGAKNFALNFIKYFNLTSDSFKRDFIGLTQRYCGHYAMHLSTLEPNSAGYIQSDSGSIVIEQSLSTERRRIWILAHELAHELNIIPDTPNNITTFPSNSGQVHSREQAAYQAGSIIPLINAGEIETFHTDATDYNNNLMFIDDFNPSWNKDIEGNYRSISGMSLADFQQIMRNIFLNCDTHDPESAASYLLSVWPTTSMTIQAFNPQDNKPLKPVTYNVRELILQHLLMAYNTKLFFGKNYSPYANLGKNIPLMLAIAIKEAPTLMVDLDKAQSYLKLPTQNMPYAIKKPSFLEALKNKETYIPVIAAYVLGLLSCALGAHCLGYKRPRPRPRRT